MLSPPKNPQKTAQKYKKYLIHQNKFVEMCFFLYLCTQIYKMDNYV